ncbi:hypothetical protein GUJ93_ZPchr0014g47660 [Zizania palustris]|uniref:chitinase n=1 Tax=Zizania palustris TaxID=103762 RepID=A0A8J5SWQ4_ZIZPA|nr:hypothetical protein GUJ93_ZPchr0014g47660 [Zizania palustris]
MALDKAASARWRNGHRGTRAARALGPRPSGGRRRSSGLASARRTVAGLFRHGHTALFQAAAKGAVQARRPSEGRRPAAAFGMGSSWLLRFFHAPLLQHSIPRFKDEAYNVAKHQRAAAQSGVSVESVVTEAFFNGIKSMASNSCAGKNFYTRQSFLTAARTYSGFAKGGSSDDAKREIAAFFAHVTHETGSK